MVRRLFTFTLPLAATALAAPAMAATTAAPSAPQASPFGVAPVGDAGLAAIHGEGLARTSFLRRAARDEFEAVNRLTAETLPVTFDNWFADVGAPLIINNQLR